MIIKPHSEDDSDILHTKRDKIGKSLGQDSEQLLELPGRLILALWS